MKRLISYVVAACLLAIIAMTTGCGGTASTGKLAYVANSKVSDFTVLNVNSNGILSDASIGAQQTTEPPIRMVFTPNKKWAYMLNAAGSTIYGYERSGNGALSNKIGSGYSINDTGSTALAVSTNSQYLYVALPNKGWLTVFEIDPTTGILTQASSTPIGYQITQLIASSSGTLLYGLAPAQNAIVTFKLTANNGTVTLAATNSVGIVPAYMILTSDGKYMYVPDSKAVITVYSGTGAILGYSPAIYAFSTVSGGGVQPMSTPIYYENPDITTTPSKYPAVPVAGAVTSDNRYLFIVNQQSHNITVFHLNDTDGSLTEVLGSTASPASPFDCGTGCTTPTFAVVAPSNNALYVLDTNASKIFQFGFNSNNGNLRILNPSFQSAETGGYPTWITIE